jgi:surface protein
LSNFDVTNAIIYEAWRYGGLFDGCSSLTSLDLSGFRTSTLSLQNMFLGCSSLKIIDLSNFNNPNTTAIEWTFNGNINLEELYLNSFDFSNITKINHPFDGVPSNVKIYVKDETQQEFIMSNVGFTIENIIIAPIVVNN